MEEQLQELEELQEEYQNKLCEKSLEFLTSNFPKGSLVRVNGENLVVTGYTISYDRPCYLNCEKIIHQEKHISLYDIKAMIERGEL